jgi:beta-glucosidase
MVFSLTFLLSALLYEQVVSLTPQDILVQMTLQDKIGQMIQLSYSELLSASGMNVIDPVKAQRVFGTYRVGSILGSLPSVCDSSKNISGSSQSSYLTFLSDLQTIATSFQTNITPPIPVVYGIDSTHGAGFLDGATLFPHSFGSTSSYNFGLTEMQAAITSLDTRAFGIPWMFSPVLGVAVNPLWSRFYETPGEDPFVGKVFAASYVRGAGKNASGTISYNQTVCASTMKHFLGYSSPRTGKDRTDAHIPDAYLKQYFQSAFEGAVSEQTPTVMINSGSVNGVPVHGSAVLLTTLLRQELGFNGVAVTDWQDILKLNDYHRVASSRADAIVLALEAGIDMSMVPFFDSEPFFADILFELVTNGTVPESRIDESVTRILQLKINLGLFTDPVAPPQLQSRIVGSESDQNIALQMARESIVMLKNSVSAITMNVSVFPIQQWLGDGTNILVVGPTAVDTFTLCGKWTNQEISRAPTPNCPSISPLWNLTLGASIAQVASKYGYKVTVMQGVNFTSVDPVSLSKVAAQAALSDLVILALGSFPIQETSGDISDLSLSPSQMELYTAIRDTETPFVTVLVQPRPQVLGPIADISLGLINAHLPCVPGVKAVAEVMFGETNPSARSSYTYPRFVNDLEVYFHKPWNASYEGVDPSVYTDPLYEFGFGLSFSNLSWSNVTVSPSSVNAGETVTVYFDISNSASSPDANVTTLLFVSQLFRKSISPETKLLKGFNKILVPSGKTVSTSIQLDTNELAYYTPALEKVIDKGTYSLNISGSGVGNYVLSELTINVGGVFDMTGLKLLKEGTETSEQRRVGSPSALLADELMDLYHEHTVDTSGPVALHVKEAMFQSKLSAILDKFSISE